MGKEMAGNRDLLVVDLATRRRAVASSADMRGMTERHSCDLMDRLVFEHDTAIERTIAAHGGGVMFVMGEGLAPRVILRHSARLLKHGRPVYYLWPGEKVVEVIDDIRLSSYRTHRALALAWFGWTQLRGHGLARFGWTQLRGHCKVRSRFGRARELGRRVLTVPTELERINQLRHEIAVEYAQLKARTVTPDSPAWLRDPTRLPTQQNPIAGHGLYVRLDYWSKIVTGGSYGHTCFLASALNGTTEALECLVANRFELLDDLNVRQRVLGAGPYSASSAGIILNALQFARPLAAAFDELRPAYVYERLVLGNRETARLCAAHRVPYIVEYNGSELAMARSFGRPYEHEALLEEIEAYAFDAATVINVVSEPVAQSLYDRGVARDKVLVNPNAVDPNYYRPLRADERSAVRRELGLADDDVVVGFSGTFGGWHGVEVLAAGLPKVCALGPKVKFLLIGDGNLKPLVRKAVADHRLEKQVVDVGLVPQALGARYVGAADILVATHAQNIDGKTFFGSPTKLFEYMATGAAIVCSDLAQLGEVMRPALLPSDFAHGTPDIGTARGLLVTPGSTEEYIEAVARLVADAELRKVLGRNAREAAINNYTWDIHVENIWRHLAGLPLRGYVNDRRSAVV